MTLLSLPLVTTTQASSTTMGDLEAPVPVLIYDGDCAFCAYWVRYWERLTGPKVRYAAYQDVARDYPEIPAAEFARAIQLIEPDGSRCSGAQAAFRVLDLCPQGGLWLWLYRHVPGHAGFAEGAYAFVAAHRGAAARISCRLWGRERHPDDYALVSWAFLRLLALIYLSAFASLSVQVDGLVESEGLLPAAEFLSRAYAALGAGAFWQIPTIFWLDASDFALSGACALGMALSFALFFNVLVRPALLLCYLLYLSLVSAGQDFLAFQWDMLLLESGFLALFLTYGSRIVIWLYRWLLFRFMFMGGVVKLASGDPSWWNLTALKYHFETQPLPSPLAWHGHLLPDAVLQAATGAVLFVELPVPGRGAHAAAGLLAAVVLSACGALLWATTIQRPPIQPFYGLMKLTSALGLVNGYGPFAIMTTRRHEIIVEGSRDGITWLPYEFKYKPGDPAKPLSWNIPHQPRLDWQMWFAALSPARARPWLPNLLEKLRENSGPALSLLRNNPFPGQPPRHVRASLYRYGFTTPQERAGSGAVWQREYLGTYAPAQP